MRCLWGRGVSGFVAALLLVVFFCASAQAGILTGLENYYNFDDPSDPGKDSSGNNRNATLSGATWVLDPIRGGVLNVGTGQHAYATVPNLYTTDPVGEFTIALWVNLPALVGNNPGLFQIQKGGPPASTTQKCIGGWVSRSTATIWGRITDTTGNRDLSQSGPPQLTPGQWTHIVYRGDGTEFQRFVNGVAVGPSVTYGSILDHDTLIIGQQGTESAVGRLDDLRVYSRSLTDTEILELFMQPFRVDFGQSDSGTPNGPIQPGFYTFEAPGSTTSSQTREFISGLGRDNLVKVTISGNTHYRDYVAITGGPFVALSPLLSDMVLRNADGTMELKLENLEPGWYWMTTYHHSTQQGGGTIDVYLTDLDGRHVIADDLLVTAGPTPTNISTLTFLFKTTGAPVLLELIGGAAMQHLSLNGFEVSIWVPEPSSGLLAFVGLMGVGMILWGRTRRGSSADTSVSMAYERAIPK